MPQEMQMWKAVDLPWENAQLGKEGKWDLSVYSVRKSGSNPNSTTYLTVTLSGSCLSELQFLHLRKGMMSPYLAVFRWSSDTQESGRVDIHPKVTNVIKETNSLFH